MNEFIAKLRKYEIRIRKAVSGHMQGDYHSVFKGSGLEFDDVRAYQYGDDVRAIDWNVSAKGHGTFIKTFREEKEQTVFFMLDVSASQELGIKGQQKSDISKEICGVLALSAIKEGSQVGLFCFSDRKEKYIKPGKGLKYAYQVITSIFNLKPVSLKTNISNAIYYCLNLVRRRSVIIIISDFIDENYEMPLKTLARLHDLVVIHVYDAREVKFPSLGIVPVFDKERGKSVWINTSSPAFRKNMAEHFESNSEKLQLFCKKHQVNYLPVDTGQDYIPDLVKLFKIRNRSNLKSS